MAEKTIVLLYICGNVYYYVKEYESKRPIEQFRGLSRDNQ